MFLTKECDYAIRIIRSLAGMSLMTVKTISENELIPQPFSYKILKRLERAGIVKSYRGPAGGYKLVMPLSGLTMFDVVNAVDDGLFVSECLQEGFECPHRSRGNICRVHSELLRLQELMINAMNEKQLSEVI